MLTNSSYRIWNWVAIRRPVAGDLYVPGGNGPNCRTAGGSTWKSCRVRLTLTQTVHKITTRNSTTGTSHPDNSGQFDSLVLTNAIAGENLCGSRSVSTINGSGNPFNGTNGCTNDNYLTVFTGQINIPTDGTYTFAVDGDDAVDLQIDSTTVASWYGGHGRYDYNTYSGSIFLSAGSHTIRFRHEENSGDDNYYLRWQRTVPASVRTDHGN
ncbi:MAG: PA14 domain-containing protein [Comamonadaceae bacterium]|nr:PA14 domain-containing protein [Comamonadaceae bacterium]